LSVYQSLDLFAILAISLVGSQDNITVMILFFGPKRQLSNSPQRDDFASHANSSLTNGSSSNLNAMNSTQPALHFACDGMGHSPASLSPQKNKLTLSGIRKKKSHSTGLTSGREGSREGNGGSDIERSPRALSSSHSPRRSPSPRQQQQTTSTQSSNSNSNNSTPMPRRTSASATTGREKERESNGKLLSNSSPAKASRSSSALLSTTQGESLPPRSTSLPAVTNNTNLNGEKELNAGKEGREGREGKEASPRRAHSPARVSNSPKIVVIDESDSSPRGASPRVSIDATRDSYNSPTCSKDNSSPRNSNMHVALSGSSGSNNTTSSSPTGNSPRVSPPSTPSKGTQTVSLRDSRKKKQKAKEDKQDKKEEK
jgi:hypothetical protein